MTILLDANKLIYGDRHDSYGEYKDQAELVKRQFEIILADELGGNEIPLEKVPLLMVGLKVVRAAQQPTHLDSWKDIAGYVGCAGKLESVYPSDTGEQLKLDMVKPDRKAFRIRRIVRSVNLGDVGRTGWYWPTGSGNALAAMYDDEGRVLGNHTNLHFEGITWERVS